jgi:outer membrane protein
MNQPRTISVFKAHFIATAALVLMAQSAMAQGSASLPLWEVGAFGTGLKQQAYPGSSQQVDRALVLPFFIYRGQYLRADGGNVGLRAVKTDILEVDVGFSGAFGSNSNDIEARKGMPDLGTLVEFGPRVKWNLGAGPGNGRLRAELALRGVFDISDSFKDKGLSLEPELIFERRTAGGVGYSASVGLVLGDERLAETFYGVAPAFATATRPAYKAQSGLIMSRVSVNLFQNLTPNLRVFGFARLTSVDSAANSSSPLVRQNMGSTVGIGLLYTLARSESRASD